MIERPRECMIVDTWAAARLAVAYLDAMATGASESPEVAEHGADA